MIFTLCVSIVLANRHRLRSHARQIDATDNVTSELYIIIVIDSIKSSQFIPRLASHMELPRRVSND